MSKVFCGVILMLGLLTNQTAMAKDFPAFDFHTDANGGIQFKTPSDNIECNFEPVGEMKLPVTGQPEITCDRAEPSYWHFYLGSAGLGEIDKNPGEQPCCGNLMTQLPYGRSFRDGPFECDSMTTGLRCERTDGHGFFISKSKANAY